MFIIPNLESKCDVTVLIHLINVIQEL